MTKLHKGGCGMSRLASIVFLLLMVLVSFGLAANLTEGYVFIDRNANGVRDNHDEPVSGALISNGIDFVRTDETGLYRIEPNEEGFVFLIVPDGYRCAEWYTRHQETHDFLLEPTQSTGVFAVVADIHYADDPDEFWEALGDREMIDDPDQWMEQLVNKLIEIQPDFILCNGDIGASVNSIDDAIGTRWLQTVEAYLATTDIPVYYTVGNHETNRRKTNPFDLFHNVFGPDYYAFYNGGIHFIALNIHHIVNGSLVYEIDDRQLEWLRKKVNMVDPNTPIMVFSHEPIFDLAKTKNNEQLIQILADFSCYHVSGHWHGKMEFFRQPYFALTSGAVSGAWWEGPSAYGDDYGFALIEFRRGVMNYAYLPLTTEPSVWFNLSNKTPHSGIELVRVTVSPNTSESMQVLLNGVPYEYPILTRQLQSWSEFFFNINFAACPDGLNEIGVQLGDQIFTKKLYVQNSPVDIKTMKDHPEYFAGSLVLIQGCENTGQSGNTYVFNDGTDIFMVQVRDLDIPFTITRNQKYSLYGIYRHGDRVASPMKIILSEGIVQE